MFTPVQEFLIKLSMCVPITVGVKLLARFIHYDISWFFAFLITVVVAWISWFIVVDLGRE
jgi:hypothetical protein